MVERSLAWLTANRRLARDNGREPRSSEALIRWAANSTMIRPQSVPATRHAQKALRARKGLANTHPASLATRWCDEPRKSDIIGTKLLERGSKGRPGSTRPAFRCLT
ncbi:hypothetical protein GCM10010443_88890 [Actinoplanes cyaneus]